MLFLCYLCFILAMHRHGVVQSIVAGQEIGCRNAAGWTIFYRDQVSRKGVKWGHVSGRI